MSKKRLLDEHLPSVKISRKWGNNSRFARALDLAPSTTDRWLQDGYVPGRYHETVVQAASRDDIVIRPEDFVDLRIFRIVE